MFQILSVFNDPFGEECKNLIEQYTTAKRPLPTPSVAIAAPTAFTQKTTIPSLNSYQDDSVQPEKPAIPKPVRTDLMMARGENEPLPDIIPETAYDSLDGFHRNDTRHGRDEGELWEENVMDERDRTRNISRSPDWERDRYHKDRYSDDRYYEKRKHSRKHRSRDRSRSRERRDSRRRRSGSRHRSSYHERRDRSREKHRHKYEKKDRRHSRHYRDEYSSSKESSSYAYASSYDTSYSQSSSQYPNYHPMPYPPMYNVQGYQVDPNSWQPPPPATAPPPPKDPPAPKPPGIDDDDEIWEEDQIDTKKGKPPPPPPPPPESTLEEGVITQKTTEEDDESNVDLDTRIAMMFKGKSFGAAPPFLQFDSDSGDEAKQHEIKQEPDDSNARISGKNSSEVKSEESSMSNGPPSPFLSKSTYKTSKKLTKIMKEKARKAEIRKEEGASDISSSDDEILLSRGTYSPLPPPGHSNTLKEDAMSLSSLSSNDDSKSLGVKSSENPPLPSSDPPSQPPLPPSTTPMYSYGYPNAPYPSSYAGAYQYNPYQYSEYMQTYMASQSAAGYFPSGYPGVTKKESPSYHVSKEEPYEKTIKTVLDRMTEELKVILKRDFNKRMIEGFAYKKYEAWWDEKERNKSKGENEAPNRQDTKAPDINQLLVNNRDTFNDTTSICLGLRAAIPKLPSFRRIRKAPSPVPKDDEDSRKSEEEDQDVVRASDDENWDTELIDVNKKTESSANKEVAAQPASRTQQQRRKGSLSSFSSSSSEEESSSDDESDEESSLSDADIAEVVPRLGPKKDDKRIYSDTESEDEEGEIKTPVAQTKPKIGIYSDTESEPEKEKTPVKVQKPQISRSKTPEGRATPIPACSAADDLEDLSDDEDVEGTSPKPPRTPGRESPNENKEDANKKSFYDLDRLYSDSEEEREYQEKRRRNTEYMEQIEREFMEEQAKKKQEEQEMRNKMAEEAIQNYEKSPMPERAPSPREPVTPSITAPPPTPGVSIQDPMAKYMQQKQQEQQERNREGSMSPKAFVIHKDVNGIVRSTFQEKVEPVHVQEFKRKQQEQSDAGSGSDAGSCKAFALDHCYSLPPSASPSSESPSGEKAGNNKKYLQNDHGYSNEKKDGVVSGPRPVSFFIYFFFHLFIDFTDFLFSYNRLAVLAKIRRKRSNGMITTSVKRHKRLQKRLLLLPFWRNNVECKLKYSVRCPFIVHVTRKTNSTTYGRS